MQITGHLKTIVVLAGLLAGGGNAGPDRLPDGHRGVPGVHVRGHRRRDVGRGGLGSLLGVGSEGNLRVHHLGDLRVVPERAFDGGLAGPARGLDLRGGIRLDHVQLVLREHGGVGTAFVRRVELGRR